MGWLFKQGYTKSDIIRDLNRRFESPDGSIVCELLANCVRGNNHWQLWERKEIGKPDVRFIALNLLGSESGYGWGYKDLDETCGPCEVNCPLSYVDRATEPKNEFARKWRESVRAYHDQIKKYEALKTGDTIRFDAPLNFGNGIGSVDTFFVSDAKRRIFQTNDKTGCSVRIRKDTLIAGGWRCLDSTGV